MNPKLVISLIISCSILIIYFLLNRINEPSVEIKKESKNVDNSAVDTTSKARADYLITNNNIQISNLKNSSLHNCREFKPFSSNPSFFQVRLHGGGTVPLLNLKQATLDLIKLYHLEHEEQDDDAKGNRTNSKENVTTISNGSIDEEFKILFWAADGTLLNFMRWGAIVNDNDVDVSFVVVPKKLYLRLKQMSTSASTTQNQEEDLFKDLAKIIRRAIVDKKMQREFYVTLLFGLVRAGIIEKPDDRILKNLRQPFKFVKPRRCHIRRGFMQCRHKNGVVYDFFGPENSFVGKPGFTSATTHSNNNNDAEEEVGKAARTLRNLFFPLIRCKSYDSEFPCPKESLKVLKDFSLDYFTQKQVSNKNQKSDEDNTKVWNEFGGCTLFTKRSQDEHDSDHLKNILQTTKKLHDCGYPSLWEDRLNVECQKLMKKVV